MPVFPRSLPRLAIAQRLITLAPLVMASACSFESFTQSDGSVGYVQFINAAPRYAGVDFYTNTELTLPNQPYGSNPIYANVPESATPQTFRALVGNDTTSIATTQSTIAFHTFYTLVLTQHTVKGGFLVLPDTVSAPAGGQAAIRVVNVAPSVPGGAVDVYITSTTTDITTVSPSASNVAFEGSSLYIPFAPGAVRVQVTAAGTKTPVLLDANPATLAAGRVWTILLLDKTGGGTPFQSVILGDR